MTKKGDILLHSAIDLTAHKPWSQKGFVIEKLYDSSTYSRFQFETRRLLLECWSLSGFQMPSDFELEKYHTHITDFNAHLNAIEHTRLVSVKQFPLGISLLEKRISEILDLDVHVLNPWDGESNFHFRIIRPKSNDNNPLHRDVWLEDYDNCINLYIPIAGSNEKSSLTLVPGSHHWPEDEVERTASGAEINGMKFNVPAVTKIHPDHEIIRPNPGENEVLVFSPYLLHGGAVNLNEDATRISIEVRLWKK